MMNDDQYLMDLFNKKFRKYKHKNIVLYGKGPMTKLLIEHYPDYNIVGIMDYCKTEGVIYGKPVLSYADLPFRKVDLIIPVARPESMKQVFKRIYRYCEQYHIQLYGLNGDNLLETCEIPQENPEPVDFIKVFRERFRDCWDKKIVLYGKGPKTQRLVEECPEYNFIGILDKNVKEGMIYGKRILNYESVQAFGADMIIAVAKPENLKYIYNRMHEFCSYHGIQLYDAEGNNLFITQKDTSFMIEPDMYFDVGEDELRKQIDVHEIISFDMFDTLVMRKTLYPVDVYAIVEDRAKAKGIGVKGFKEQRWEAEMNTVQEIPDIYRIYNELQRLTGINDNQKDELLRLELETERAVLIPRSHMVSVLNYAVEQGKQVYIVSDMYLPEKILGGILSELGISGYKKLFVSCEYHKNKVTGLYKVFKEYVRGNSYLHIGDNYYADCVYSQQNGLDSFYIKKASEMLPLSGYAPIQCYTSNINERLIVGLFIAKALNNPFCLHQTDGRVKVDEVYSLGYMFVGPLITKFILWLTGQMREGNFDEILFSARDGYLIQRLYDKYLEKRDITDAPRGIYFRSSRHAAVCASMRTEEDIRWISSLPYYSTPEIMIHESFDLPLDQILPYDSSRYPDIVSYGLAHKDRIFENSLKLAGRYLKYMEHLGLKPDGTYALFDFVSSGTCHFSLNKIVPFRLEGIYVCNYDCRKPEWRAMPSKAMFIQNRVVQDNSYGSYIPNNYFYYNYLFLETVITSPECTLTGFTEEGEPVYGEETRTMEELRFVQEMQKGIEDFFEAYIDLEVSGTPVDTVLVDRIYSMKDLRYTNECCKILDNFALREDMIHGSIPLNRR
jgi:FMN phosphatase YigB (HAD superfamily)